MPLVRKKQTLPKENDLVICTITKVFSHGAFANLDEYEGKAGFVHISEIASTWVKNIRDFVKEGQKTVAKVLRVDHVKGHIDLSTRRVGEAQKKNKMQEWKRAQKAEKLLEMAAKEINSTLEEAYKDVGFKLEEKYGEIYEAFEEITVSGEEAMAGLKIPQKWHEPIIKLVKENVAIPYVNITGYLDLKSLAPNGVEVIRDSLIKAREEGSKTEDVDLEIAYMGSPRYRVKVVAPDYKTAEEALRKCADRAIRHVQENMGQGEFLREIKEE
jgi:translation initiation factor 2 subunit 1